jgi:hypothetical protein
MVRKRDGLDRALTVPEQSFVFKNPSRPRLFSYSLSSAPPPPPANSVEAAFEEDVRRYLMRKPMTTTELVLIG